VYAYIYRDTIDTRKKYLKTERLALEKSAATTLAPTIAKEARDAWRAYWLAKLQTKSLDEVAKYLMLESVKRAERSDFAGARASVASIHLFATELSPAVQKELDTALARADAALAEAERKKKARDEADKRAEVERQRAMQAQVQAQRQRELQAYIRQQSRVSCSDLKARLKQNREYARSQSCVDEHDQIDAAQPKCAFYVEQDLKANLVLDAKKCPR